MTAASPSRATLQDVLRAIDTAPALTSKRRQDLRSAIRLVSKVLDSEPHSIAADPRALGRRLATISLVKHGISKSRGANSKSLLRAALNLAVPVMSGASKTPLLPEWEPLAVEARKLGSSWLRLTRLVRWLSAEGITPQAASLADLDRFQSMLLSDAMLDNPGRTLAAMRRSWERVRQAHPGWPQVALIKKPNPRVYSLSWSAFPPSFKIDVDAMLARLAGKDLSADGPIRPLRPRTLKLREHQLRTFASALVHQGKASSDLLSIGACLTLENYHLGLQWFYTRTGSERSATLHNLAADLEGIAKHWVKSDPAVLKEMSRLVTRLKPLDQGISKRTRERVRPFDDIDKQREIINLPMRIRRHLDSAKTVPLRKVGLSTAAMALELLLIAPVRIENLSRLHLDHNFIKVGNRLLLHIPAEDVKNRAPLEFDLPDYVVETFEWYQIGYRRASPENRYLFAGSGLTHRTVNTLRSQITQTIQMFMGLTVNPHLFRSIAGSIYLTQHPGGIETLRLVLGHQNTNTTLKAYAGHMDRLGRQHFANTVQELRVSQTQKGARP